MSEAKYIFYSDLRAKLAEYRQISREEFLNIQLDVIEEYKYEKGILEGIDRVIKFLEDKFSN